MIQRTEPCQLTLVNYMLIFLKNRALLVPASESARAGQINFCSLQICFSMINEFLQLAENYPVFAEKNGFR